MSPDRITDHDRLVMAMTLAGEIDQSMSPLNEPETLQEMAAIIAVGINRYSTTNPRTFGENFRGSIDGTRSMEQMARYDSLADVFLQQPSSSYRQSGGGQFSAFNPGAVATTRTNFDRNPEFWLESVDRILSGEIRAGIGNATHYRATWMAPPRWAPRLDNLGTSGAHVFYSDVNYSRRELGGVRPSYAQMEFALQPSQQSPQTSARTVPNPIAPPIPTARPDTAPSLPSVPNPIARPTDLPPSTVDTTPFSYEPPQQEVGLPLASSPLANSTRDPFGIGYSLSENSVSVPRSDALTSLMDPGGTHVMPIEELNFAAGMTSDPEGNYHRLSEDMQRLITRAYASMPEDLREKIELTSTYRVDRHQNHLGEAIDVRTRTLTPAEQAIVAGSFAQAGAVGLGVYDASYAGGAHIHVDLTGRFQSVPGNQKGLPTAVQPLSMTARQNPHLGPVYSAMMQPPGERSGVMLDLARRGLPTLPDPVPRPNNLTGPRSSFLARPSIPAGLPAAPPRLPRAETTPRLSETYTNRGDTGSPVLPSRPIKSPDEFQYSSAPTRSSQSSGLPRAQPQSSFLVRPAPVISGLADAPRRSEPARVALPVLRRTSDQVRDRTQWPGGSTVAPPTARISDFTPGPAQPPQRRASNPTQAPQLSSQRGFFLDMTGADYRSPVQAPRTPQAPSISRSTMAEQYGLRALERAAPSVSPGRAELNPGTLPAVTAPQVPAPTVPPSMVPAPMMRPATSAPLMLDPRAVPRSIPRSVPRYRSVPNPVVSPVGQSSLMNQLQSFGLGSLDQSRRGPLSGGLLNGFMAAGPGGAVIGSQTFKTRSPALQRQGSGPKRNAITGQSGGSGKVHSQPPNSQPSGFNRGNKKNPGGSFLESLLRSNPNSSSGNVGGYYSGGHDGGFTW